MNSDLKKSLIVTGACLAYAVAIVAVIKIAKSITPSTKVVDAKSAFDTAARGESQPEASSAANGSGYKS